MGECGGGVCGWGGGGVSILYQEDICIAQQTFITQYLLFSFPCELLSSIFKLWTTTIYSLAPQLRMVCESQLPDCKGVMFLWGYHRYKICLFFLLLIYVMSTVSFDQPKNREGRRGEFSSPMCGL